jgi:hypothetical protein
VVPDAVALLPSSKVSGVSCTSQSITFDTMHASAITAAYTTICARWAVFEHDEKVFERDEK